MPWLIDLHCGHTLAADLEQEADAAEWLPVAKIVAHHLNICEGSDAQKPPAEKAGDS